MESLFNSPMTMFGLIAVALCALGLFVWFFWDKLRHKLQGPESTPVLILDEGTTVKDMKLRNKRFCLSNEVKQEAWVYHPDAVQYTKDGEVACVVLTQDGCLPQFPGTECDIEKMYAEFEELVRPIALSQFHAAYENEIKSQATSPLQEWMGLAVILAVGGVLAMVIIMLLTSDMMPW